MRHAPLFALAAAPGLARLIDGLPMSKRDAAAGDDLARWSVWPAVVTLGMGLAVLAGVVLGRSGPDALAALRAARARPAAGRGAGSSTNRIGAA